MGNKMDFSDMAKILEEVNNSKITKDSLSLRDEDLSYDGEIEEKEDELIVCEPIKEETYIRFK